MDGKMAEMAHELEVHERRERPWKFVEVPGKRRPVIVFWRAPNEPVEPPK